MKNIVAIVGRPNVGKSTLFNRIIGKRVAIVHLESGVTRDRNYGEAEWNGKKFFIIDTGGYVPYSEDTFEKCIREQVKIAVDEADKIIFVVDAQDSVHPADMEIAKLLRKFSERKKIILAVNKVDNEKRELETGGYYSLGLGDFYNISALSGRNVADMLDKLTEDFTEADTARDSRIKIAIIGRPNAGKSSIVNAILKEDRNIVTEIPGTTRDSIDSVLKYYGKEIVLIDTAGLRKKTKANKGGAVDFYSTVRTYKSIQRCDVAVVVIDASLLFESFTRSSDMKLAPFKLDKQDVRIIQDVINYNKGLLIVINKWDLIEKETNTAEIISGKIINHLRSFRFLKIIFISALTKQRIHKVLESAMGVFSERIKKIKTSLLNEKLLPEIKFRPPASAGGKEVKINYITQIQSAPPVFLFFVNEPKLINDNYKKFLENKIREHFGFEGVPVTLRFRKKNKK